MSIANPLRTLPLLLVLAVSPLLAQEPLLLDEDSGALLDLEGETRLQIRDIQGTFSLRLGKSGELRYEARTRDNTRAPKTVALWLDGRTLRIMPPDGESGANTLIEIAIPPELDLDLVTSGSIVKVSALEGSLKLSGSEIELSARGMKGAAVVEVEKSRIFFSGGEDTIDVSGKEIAFTAEYLRTELYLALEESTVEISQTSAEIEGELESTTFDGSDLQGRVMLTVDEGEVSLVRASGGGELDLEAAPLEMDQTQGDLTVRTDSNVRFAKHDGALRIIGYGAAIQGSGSEGTLEIETDGAQVHLENLGGASTIRGDDLELQILGSKGAVSIHTTSSGIIVRKATGTVVIENDFGDISIAEAAEQVEVTSRDGNVVMTGLKAPVKVKADGRQLEVRWVSFSSKEGSSVVNLTGSVVVGLPASMIVRIDAKAPHGHIETNFPDIAVSGDGHSASGLTGRGRVSPQGKWPSVRIRSGGELFIGTGRN
jgi:hypothetical protein